MKVFNTFFISILAATQILTANHFQEEYSMLPTQKETLKPFSIEAKSIVQGMVYEHYSGKRYKIVSVGRNSETLEESVVYQALYGEQDIWIRPLSMFLENVVIKGSTQPRFRLID